MIRIPETSREYVKVPIESDQDPTSQLVEVALLDSTTNDQFDDPAETDWVAASWETIDGVHYARSLVGPGGETDPGKGEYWMWVRVTYDPEQVVRNVGRLSLT